MNVITIRPRSFDESAIPTDEIITVGYIPGTFTFKSSGSTGMWLAFDGNLNKSFAASALTPSQSTDGILGYDFEFSHPNGIKIEKVEVTSTNDQGFILSANPTDTKIELQGWDGVWNALGDTGNFTDGTTTVTKTITSTDQTTLFTRFRVIVSTTTTATRAIAQVKLFQISQGEVSFNLADGNNITPGLNTENPEPRVENAVNGILHQTSASNVIADAITTSDFVFPIIFDRPRRIARGIAYGSSNVGFVTTDPTDMAIKLEGFNGSIWVSLGITPDFTDANSLAKEIISSDQVTLFEKARFILSSTANVLRLYSELEVYTPLPVPIPSNTGYAMGGNDAGGGTQDNDSYVVDTWTARTDLLTPVRSSAGGASLSGKGYIFSGSDGISRVRDVDEFDPATDSWKVRTDIILPARNNAAHTAILGKGYMFGGTDAVGNLSDADEYNASLDSWTAKTAMIAPARSQFHCATVLNKGYVFCGFTTVRIQDTDEYDPDTWTAKTNAPSPARLDAVAFTLPTNIAYLCGGLDNVGAHMLDNDEYNPDTWTSRTNMPAPARTEATAFTIDTKGYVAYGNSPTQLTDTDEYIFDSWTSVSAAPAPARSGPSSGITI